jgi:Mrp family chromosome partitioning ATPase
VGGVHVRKQEADVRSTAVIAQPFSPKLPPLKNIMDQAFKDLTMDFDIVLVDAAPILISAETEYLARFADVTILIAESGKTTKVQLTRAARLLERLQIPGMSVIINKISYRWANRATREDLSAFEARMEAGNAKWDPSWNSDETAAHDDPERLATEDSTYA